MDLLAKVYDSLHAGFQSLVGVVPQIEGPKKQNENKERDSGPEVIFVSPKRLNKGLYRLG